MAATNVPPAPEIHPYRHRLCVTDLDYLGHVGTVYCGNNGLRAGTFSTAGAWTLVVS